MPTEREELRLTVSLVDNVSAGLNKIKGEFKDLTEGSGKGHAEKFKKENAEATAVLKRMGGEAGEVYKAFGMMRLGALGAAGGVALLGFEIAKQIKEWGDLADKIPYEWTRLRHHREQIRESCRVQAARRWRGRQQLAQVRRADEAGGHQRS